MASSGSIWVSLGLKTDQFSKGISSAKGQMNGFKKSTDGINGALSKVGGLMAGAFAVSSIVSFGSEAVELAGKLQGIENAFNQLNNPTLLDNLRKATKGTVSDLELMQNAVKAKNLGVPVEKLGTLFEFARRRAKETGESVDYLVESVVTGIGRKSPMILDNLGISASALKDEFKKTGDFGKAAANIIESEMKNMSPDIDTAAESAAQLNATWDNMKTSIGGLIAAGLKPLIPTLSSVADQMKRIADGEGMIISESEKVKNKFKLIKESGTDAANETGAKFQELGLKGKKLNESLLRVANTQKQYAKEARASGNINLAANYAAEVIQLQKLAKDAITPAKKEIVELTDEQKKAAAATAQMRKEQNDLANSFVNVQSKAAQVNSVIGSMQLDPIRLDIRLPEQQTWQQMAAGMSASWEQMNLAAKQAELQKIQDTAYAVGGAVQNAFSGLGASVVASFGEATTGIDQFKMTMVQMAVDLIAQALSVSIANAIIAGSSSGAAAGPAAAFVTPALIATTVGSVIGAFAAIPAFADGGVISGPTMGLMGEYAGARNNPEVVAPLDKLQSMISNNGDGMVGDVTFRIEGTTLVGILKRADKSMKYSN